MADRVRAHLGRKDKKPGPKRGKTPSTHCYLLERPASAAQPQGQLVQEKGGCQQLPLCPATSGLSSLAQGQECAFLNHEAQPEPQRRTAKGFQAFDHSSTLFGSGVKGSCSKRLIMVPRTPPVTLLPSRARRLAREGRLEQIGAYKVKFLD
jgi:hypothetical protein